MGFNCNRFSIKLVKIAQDNWSRNLAHDWLGTQHSWKGMWEAHVEVQELVHLVSILRLGQLVRWPDNWDFKCDSYTLHPYYIYPTTKL